MTKKTSKDSISAKAMKDGVKSISVDEDAVWKSVKDEIKRSVTPQQFTTWFANLELIKINKHDIYIHVPNYFCKDWLDNKYKSLLNSAINKNMNFTPRINLVVDDESKPDELEPIVYRNTDNSAVQKHVCINKTYTFENFLVGPCNRLAHAAALSICDSPGTTYNPLFIHGPVGLGKTHLLQAIYLELQRGSNKYNSLFLPCETFVNHYISTIKTGDWDSFRNTYRQIDILLIDDVHFLANSQNSREEFFHTFNALYNRQKQIVLSSDCPPEEIPTIEDRLISRFRWGLITRIDPPGFETSIAIIQRKAALLKIKLTNNVVSFLAENTSSNVREIEGALLNINKYSLLNKNIIDLELVKRVIHKPAKQNNFIGIENILGTITKHFGVQLSSLHSKRKLKSITLPRQIAMYLARKFTNLSLEEIGGYMGGRDHTTVMHAVGKIKKMKKDNRNIYNTIRKIEKELIS